MMLPRSSPSEVLLWARFVRRIIQRSRDDGMLTGSIGPDEYIASLILQEIQGEPSTRHDQDPANGGVQSAHTAGESGSEKSDESMGVLLELWDECKHNVTRTAQITGLSRKTVVRHLRQFKIAGHDVHGLQPERGSRCR